MEDMSQSCSSRRITSSLKSPKRSGDECGAEAVVDANETAGTVAEAAIVSVAVVLRSSAVLAAGGRAVMALSFLFDFLVLEVAVETVPATTDAEGATGSDSDAIADGLFVLDFAPFLAVGADGSTVSGDAGLILITAAMAGSLESDGLDAAVVIIDVVAVTALCLVGLNVLDRAGYCSSLSMLLVFVTFGLASSTVTATGATGLLVLVLLLLDAALLTTFTGASALVDGATHVNVPFFVVVTTSASAEVGATGATAAATVTATTGGGGS